MRGTSSSSWIEYHGAPLDFTTTAFCAMATIMQTRSLLRVSRAVSTFNCQPLACHNTRSRGFADVASTDDGKLPLKGYRVLDLTRVLAGVCMTPDLLCRALKFFNSPIVHKFLEILGMLLLPRLRNSALAADVIRAEVIKVEHPERGDDTRAWGPPYAKYVDGTRREGPGESAYFLSVRHFYFIEQKHS